MAHLEQLDYSKTSSEFDEWFGLSQPYFMLITLSLYLLFVLKIGPRLMKNKAPFQLTAFMVFYNVAQVCACVYIIAQVFNITTGEVLKFWKCKIFSENTRQEYLFNRISYFTFWLKMIELVETIVFVLRKKQNQVSFLHVFHHCSTVTLIYVLLKSYTGGSALYPLLLNSTVHVIMYSYYLVAATCDKKIVRRLTPIKKSITIIQMIQFVLILLQAFMMFPNCPISRYVLAYYSAVVGVIFYGFYDFYKKSYTPKSKSSL